MKAFPPLLRRHFIIGTPGMSRSLNGNRGRSWRFSPPLQKKAPVIHINQEVLHDKLSG